MHIYAYVYVCVCICMICGSTHAKLPSSPGATDRAMWGERDKERGKRGGRRTRGNGLAFVDSERESVREREKERKREGARARESATKCLQVPDT